MEETAKNRIFGNLFTFTERVVRDFLTNNPSPDHMATQNHDHDGSIIEIFIPSKEKSKYDNNKKKTNGKGE